MADDAEAAFDLIISASASAPTGVTNYRKLGSFTTQASSTDVQPGSVANVGNESSVIPSTRVYSNTNIAISHATNTALSFNSERFDTDKIHSTTSNTTRLTVRTAGKYLIFGHIQWAAVGAADTRHAYIRLNGTTIIADQYSWHDGSTGHNRETAVTTVYNLAVGDYLELVVRQETGAALNILSTANYSPEFGVIWLSN